jgi:hypothetical protein
VHSINTAIKTGQALPPHKLTLSKNTVSYLLRYFLSLCHLRYGFHTLIPQRLALSNFSRNTNALTHPNDPIPSPVPSLPRPD